PGRGAIGPQGAVRDPGEPGRSIAVAPESRRRGAWPAAGLPPLFAGASPPSPPSPEPPVPVRARTALRTRATRADRKKIKTAVNAMVAPAAVPAYQETNSPTTVDSAPIPAASTM